MTIIKGKNTVLAMRAPQWPGYGVPCGGLAHAHWHGKKPSEEKNKRDTDKRIARGWQNTMAATA